MSQPSNSSSAKLDEDRPLTEYRRELQRRAASPEQRDAGCRAIDRYAAAARRGTLLSEDLACVVAAARSADSVVWDVGIELLSRLAARHEVARDALWAMSAEPRAGLRRRALYAVHDRLPRPFCVELARRGLADRSRGIRHGAAEVCRCYLLADLLLEVQAVAAAEQHPPTRLEMQVAAGLLQNVYFRYPNEDDGLIAFVVRVSDGLPASMLWPGDGECANPEDDHDAARFADQIRRQMAHTWRPFRWDQASAEQSAAADGGGR